MHHYFDFRSLIMASRRARLSVSPSRLEKSPSTDLELAPLTERTHREDRHGKGDRPKTISHVKRDRRPRTLPSSTQSKQTPAHHEKTVPASDLPPTMDIDQGPTETADNELRAVKNQTRNTRRRRARLESELEAAENRLSSGVKTIPAHTLQDLITPLGASTPTLDWSVMPMEIASSFYYLLPIIVNDHRGTCVSVWLPSAPYNIVPSYMIRVQHPPDEAQLEQWSLDEGTSIMVGAELEVTLRFGHALANTTAKESPSCQVPILGGPATLALGIMLCPIRNRVSNAHGDFINSIRCMRKQGRGTATPWD